MKRYLSNRFIATTVWLPTVRRDAKSCTLSVSRRASLSVKLSLICFAIFFSSSLWGSIALKSNTISGSTAFSLPLPPMTQFTRCLFAFYGFFGFERQKQCMRTRTLSSMVLCTLVHCLENTGIGVYLIYLHAIKGELVKFLLFFLFSI